MAELQTKRTKASVDKFLNSIKDEQVRNDCWTIVDIMQKATKAKPEMWGPAIIGFGEHRYKYPDGREMDWMITAFSPRKQNITLYIMWGLRDNDRELLTQLGKHSCSPSCLYIKRLSDVHLPTLKKLINASVKQTTKQAFVSPRHA